MAITETKRGNDVERYLELMRYLSNMLAPEDPEGVPDLGWVDSKTKQVKAEGDKLEQQLKGYKNNLIKESIRVCIFVHVSLYCTASALPFWCFNLPYFYNLQFFYETFNLLLWFLRYLLI